MRRVEESTLLTDKGPMILRYLSEDTVDDMYLLLLYKSLDTRMNGTKHDEYVPREIKNRYIKMFGV